MKGFSALALFAGIALLCFVPGAVAAPSLTLSAVLRDVDIEVGTTQEGRKYDFEMEPLDDFLGHRLGLVDRTLGADRTPIFNTSACVALLPACDGVAIHSPTTFAKWYHDGDETKRVTHQLVLTPNEATGMATFSSHDFFPLDSKGWGDAAPDEAGVLRNFGFTTEIHTEFTYSGGEVFQFSGDDDVWVFIDDQLVIDIGGVHGVVCRKIVLDPRVVETDGASPHPLFPTDCGEWVAAEELDAPLTSEAVRGLRLVVGETYHLDMFHAERHTAASNFAMTTNMMLSTVTVDADAPITRVVADGWMTSSGETSTTTTALRKLEVGGDDDAISLMRFAVDELPLFVESATLSLWLENPQLTDSSAVVEVMLCDCQVCARVCLFIRGAFLCAAYLPFSVFVSFFVSVSVDLSLSHTHTHSLTPPPPPSSPLSFAVGRDAAQRRRWRRSRGRSRDRPRFTRTHSYRLDRHHSRPCCDGARASPPSHVDAERSSRRPARTHEDVLPPPCGCERARRWERTTRYLLECRVGKCARRTTRRCELTEWMDAVRGRW